MKKTFSTLILTLGSLAIFGQINLRPEKLKPTSPFENIQVQKLAGDSLSSSFVIWIKKDVKSHYHLFHSEVVIVLSGKGMLQLGEKTVKLRKGEFVFIPKGTVHSVKTTSRKPLEVLSIQAPQFDGSDRVLIDLIK